MMGSRTFSAVQLRSCVEVYDFDGIVLTHVTARKQDKCALKQSPHSARPRPQPAGWAESFLSNSTTQTNRVLSVVSRSWEVRFRCKLRLRVTKRGRGPAVEHRVVDSVNNAARNKEARREEIWWLRQEVLDTLQEWE